MANIKVSAENVIIESSASLEELKRIERFTPEALQLSDEDGKVYFGINTGNQSMINEFGVTFADETIGDAKHAYITIPVLESVKSSNDDIKTFVAENYGKAIKNLNTIESKLSDITKKINDDIDEVKSLVEFANSED